MIEIKNSILDFFVKEGVGYLWLIAAIILLLFELGAPGLFFFISFSIGCLGGALLAFLGMHLYVQIVGALALSIIGFFGLKKLFLQRKNRPKFKTNIDALIGKTGIVIKTIEPQKTGKVRIGGERWTALAHEPVILQENTVVTVVNVRGNKVIVK